MTFDLFTAHIFFDDAFEYHGKEGKANGYVKQLIRTIDVAIRLDITLCMLANLIS